MYLEAFKTGNSSFTKLRVVKWVKNLGTDQAGFPSAPHGSPGQGVKESWGRADALNYPKRVPRKRNSPEQRK